MISIEIFFFVFTGAAHDVSKDKEKAKTMPTKKPELDDEEWPALGTPTAKESKRKEMGKRGEGDGEEDKKKNEKEKVKKTESKEEEKLEKEEGEVEEQEEKEDSKEVEKGVEGDENADKGGKKDDGP